MHDSAFEFVRKITQSLPPLFRVAEFGSKITNGTVCEIFTDATGRGGYVGIDIVPGPNVNVVMDAAEWNGHGTFDCVVCCEVLEHTPRAMAICFSAFRALRRGGCFILTCATDPRPPHSAHGKDDMTGEHYANPSYAEVREWLSVAGFDVVLFDIGAPVGDLYCFAMRVR